jgi:hypothetical protein
MADPKRVTISVSYEEDNSDYKQSLKKVILTTASTGEIMSEIDKMEQNLTGKVPML